MEISGEYTFDAPQDMVWEALLDPEVLGNVMPGGEGFEEVAENEYAGMMNIKVGPVNGKFKGGIVLSDLVEPESFTMVVDGKGAPGFVKASGGMKLTPQGEKTHIAYEGTAQVGGRIASVGQRLLDASAKSILSQSLEGLNAYFMAEQALQAAVEAAVEAEGISHEEAARAAAHVHVPQYSPPSQTAVAMNVAKDVIDEYIPPAYRPVLVAGLVMLILSLLFRRRRPE